MIFHIPHFFADSKELTKINIYEQMNLALFFVNPNKHDGEGNHPPSSENRVFSATEHRMNPRPICKFKFCRCGQVEKN